MKQLFFLLSITFTTAFPYLLIGQIEKTFSDTYFNKGDIIRVPNLEIELLNNETNVMNDSLNLLVDFLQKHKNIKFEIACHTDSRGNLEGNKKSSQYRAQGIRDHLIKTLNINSDLLTAKGYGESKIIISDEIISGGKTKEEKERLHRINRRIELIVLEIK